MFTSSPVKPEHKRHGSMTIARTASWGLWIYYDPNDPPYMCRVAVHVGPWMFFY